MRTGLGVRSATWWSTPRGRAARAVAEGAGSAMRRGAGSGAWRATPPMRVSWPRSMRIAGGDPEAVRGEHVTQAARAGDPEAQAVLDELAWWVALGLANLANALTPSSSSSAGDWWTPSTSCSHRCARRSTKWWKGAPADRPSAWRWPPWVNEPEPSVRLRWRARAIAAASSAAYATARAGGVALTGAAGDFDIDDRARHGRRRR